MGNAGSTSCTALTRLYRADKADDGSWSPEAASILDMYAYVYDTGKVIRSGRTAWSDPGTQEYIDATEN